jgi:hypothetical protein
MLRDDAEDVFDIVTGIDDHCFPALLVSYDGAIALQYTDREYLVDHRVRVTKIFTAEARRHEI